MWPVIEACRSLFRTDWASPLRHSKAEVVRDRGIQWWLPLEQKTKGVEYMPISEQAFQLCGERKDGEQLVFAGLPDPSWINRPIKKWVAEAGITKHITYHCARHSVFSFSLKFNSLQNISA